MWCALIACLALEPSSGGREAPDFSGSWVRDQRASDDPVEKAKDQNVQVRRAAPAAVRHLVPRRVWYPGSGRGPSRGGGGGGGTTGPGGGTPGAGTPGSGGGPYGGGPTGGPAGRGGGGSGGGGRGGQGPELDIDGAVRLAGGVQAWSVDHREPQIVIRDANRETRVLFTDGRVMGDGIDTKTIANWRGDTLEVETKSSLGVKTERWQLDHDREVLTVVTTLEMDRGNELSFTTVFDRVEGGATATAGAGSVRASAGGEGDLDADARGPSRDDAEPVEVAGKDAEPVDAPARGPARRSRSRSSRRTVARPGAGGTRARVARGDVEDQSAAAAATRGSAAQRQGHVRHPDHRPGSHGGRVLPRRRSLRAPCLAAVPGQARPRLAAARAGGAGGGARRRRSRAG